jgi:crotonobetainyl-CoA hydratase
MDKTEFCTVRREGRVTFVTIDRPEVMNALHPPAHEELAAVFDRFAADPEAWVAVLTGTGERAFCAGSDLKVLARGGGDNTPANGFAGLTARFDLAKPVIASVNGLALGGGLETVLACDLVVAAAHARFGFPEPKVGLAALGGGLHRLVRQIPLKQAMELILTGRIVDAQEARQLGLVNQVVPASELESATLELVDAILDCAPLASQASKAVAMASLNVASVADAISQPHPAAERMLASDDAREGPRAFAEKRPPNWQGR